MSLRRLLDENGLKVFFQVGFFFLMPRLNVLRKCKLHVTEKRNISGNNEFEKKEKNTEREVFNYKLSCNRGIIHKQCNSPM